MGRKQSAFMKRQKIEKDAVSQICMDWGRQLSFDAVQIVLHRKFGWGAKRLMLLNEECQEVCEEIMRGMERRQDADYIRAKIDQIMVEIYGDKAGTWEERYTGWTEGSIEQERRWK